MALVSISVEFDSEGNALITKGDGSKYKVTDPAKLAKIMEQLAAKLGPVIEKHAAHTHVHLDGGKIKADEHVQE